MPTSTGSGAAALQAPAAGCSHAVGAPGLLFERAAESPQRTALRHKDRGLWSPISWREYAQRVRWISAGLLQLGLEPNDRVAIHANNRPEWVYTELGVQAVGGASVGIYPTSPPNEVEHVLRDSGTRFLVAEDQEQVDKALAVADRCEALEGILVVDTRGLRSYGSPLLRSYHEVEQAGAELDDRDPERLDRQMAEVDPGSPAMVVYTSGTTGAPKGAVLSHACGMACSESAAAVFEPRPNDEFLSYLPLCHVGDRIFTLWLSLRVGATVSFAERPETVLGDLAEIQPTIVPLPPRICQKTQAAVEIGVSDAPLVKRAVYGACLRLGRWSAMRRLARRGQDDPVTRALGGLTQLLAFHSIRAKAGLARVRLAMTGAAPVSPDTIEFFHAIGVPVVEAYGLTEFPVVTYTRLDDVRLGTAGTAAPGAEISIADDGEILLRGPQAFTGYWNASDATAEKFTEDGWVLTGDIGELDGDGHLRIVDRKKDVMITAGGKNLTPSAIENALKSSPYIREAIAIGEGRRFVTALIGIESDTVADWAQRRGIAYTSYTDLSSRPEVRELIDGEVAVANEQLARVSQVKKFRLLPKELDHEDDEVTATFKVKRQQVTEKFAELVEPMYEDA